MIDLDGLRNAAKHSLSEGASWYDHEHLLGRVESFDFDFVTKAEPAVILELLDILEAAQRDTEIVDWMETQGRVNIERVREGHVDGPLRWDVEYGYYEGEARSKMNMRDAFNKAMKAKND